MKTYSTLSRILISLVAVGLAACQPSYATLSPEGFDIGVGQACDAACENRLDGIKDSNPKWALAYGSQVDGGRITRLAFSYTGPESAVPGDAGQYDVSRDTWLALATAARKKYGEPVRPSSFPAVADDPDVFFRDYDPGPDDFEEHYRPRKDVVVSLVRKGVMNLSTKRVTGMVSLYVTLVDPQKLDRDLGGL